MRVPITDSVAVIHQFLTEDNRSADLVKLVEECLFSTCFTFQGGYHEQTSGSAMGSSLLSVVVDIFMETKRTIKVCRRQIHHLPYWQRHPTNLMVMIFRKMSKYNVSIWVLLQ